MEGGMRRVMVVLSAVVFVLASGSSGLAQRPAGLFPVIVVFRADAPVDQFRGSFRADDRAAANPEAWDYLDRGVVGATMALENQHRFRAEHVFSEAVRGFSAQLTIAQMAALERHPLVDYIEADGTMVANAQTTPWGITRIGAAGKSSLPGVNAYIIDTGVDTAHPDLTVVGHVNFAGGPNRDCNGHGTHVAGTVAAIDNAIDVVGVAAGAALRGVKVLGCGGSGSTSGVIKGVDWVKNNAVTPAVANMSLSGGASTTLDNAVKNAANSGVTFVLAAGNSGANACNYSPARAGTHNGVLTVAATDSADNEPSWSNYGNCVDIWAPGVGVESTRRGGGTTTLSGTSMASPHVAGTAARYLGIVKPTASAAEVEADLKAKAVLLSTTSKDGRRILIVQAGAY
jgi:subtilisin family serine protease